MNGRWIADRPDVPEGLDPSDLILPRTERERRLINEGIDLYVAELKAALRAELEAERGT